MIYIKQLDSIRTFAVMLVIISHWLPLYYIKLFDFGAIGVNLFFVLSGFLITQMLFENRKDTENNGTSKINIIKSFIIRRSLRIFTIYYLTIFILLIIGHKTGTDIREDFTLYFFYLSNFLFFFKQEWDGMLSHLWSLAVEEQFYLFWPWLMIFIRRNFLFIIIAMFFFIGIAANYLIPGGNSFIQILTPTCFDSFSLGGILAYAVVYSRNHLNFILKYLPFVALLCLVTFFFSTLSSINVFIPDRTLVSFCALYLIVFAIYKQGSVVHTYILNNKTLIFTGQISYGVYLYQNIVPNTWNMFIDKLNDANIQIPLINAYIPASLSREIMLVEQFVLLIIISWLSWKFIEFPINSLKNRFSYKKIAHVSVLHNSQFIVENKFASSEK